MSSTNFETLPLQLWQRPVKDPYKLLEAFFQFAGYADAQQLLLQWYTAALSEAHMPVGKAPGNLRFFTERVESLVYAAKLLHRSNKRNNINATMEKARDCIDAFFNYQSWPQWRLALHQWQAAAFSRYSVCEEVGPGAVMPFCRHMNRLLKAMYWLHTINKNRDRLQLPDTLQPVLQSVIGLLQPQYIFALQGSGYTSLLVVLPDGNSSPYKAYDELLSMAAIRHPRLSISLHKASSIAQRLSDGHAWYSRVCVAARLVYQIPGSTLPLTPPEKLEALDKAAAAVFKTHFTPATGFLQSAGQALRQKNLVYTLFLLHQAAELALRAVTLALTGHEVKTHEIRQLRLHTARCAPQLLQPLEQGKNHDALLLLLDNAYSQARYNPAFTAGKKDVKELFSRIERLLRLAEKKFE